MEHPSPSSLPPPRRRPAPLSSPPRVRARSPNPSFRPLNPLLVPASDGVGWLDFLQERRAGLARPLRSLELPVVSRGANSSAWHSLLSMHPLNMGFSEYWTLYIWVSLSSHETTKAKGDVSPNLMW
ncbi:hypothetical protein BRADI_4g16024v3 [Brachypodium distachyon]|uniref:Uncharacterized protein n=1 Tax=Brachypodium distachyon TaxID=15368 RepID=A0A0Q3EPD7_BRADI|nr:hypothetical protein BRADI_4g16024v3 [Brachypodium distachyon]